MNTTPCLKKATNNLELNAILNLMNMDASGDRIQVHPTTNNKNSDLNNNVLSKEVHSPTQITLWQKEIKPKSVR